MRKLLLIFFSLFTFLSYGQLSEDFEGTATVDASGNWPLTSGNWLVFDNGIGSTSATFKWGPTTFGSFVCNDNRAATVNRENVTDGTFAEDWLVTPQSYSAYKRTSSFYTNLHLQVSKWLDIRSIMFIFLLHLKIIQLISHCYNRMMS